MKFLLRNHISNARESFRANRSRALLTSVGIAIGMACIVTILSISGGLRKIIAESTSGGNSGVLVVRPESNRLANNSSVLSLIGTSQTYASSSLTSDDASAIKDVEGVESTAPIASFETDLVTHDSTNTAQVIATTSDLESIAELPLAYGQFISSDLSFNQIVLGNRLSNRLLDAVDTIGETVRVRGEVFLVVGVLEELDQPFNATDTNFDEVAIIGIDQASQINPNLQIQQISVQLTDPDQASEVQTRVTDLLLERHSGVEDFSVLDGTELSGSTRRLFDIITGVLGLVGGVSLIVGGIGVMNIMLVSVSERTREIGIRKSVGASDTNILIQFLFEALVLSLIGAMLGLVFGYAFAFAASQALPFWPEVSWRIVGITFGVAVIVSCIFGLFPAIRAARKDPIDSLRQYR